MPDLGEVAEHSPGLRTNVSYPGFVHAVGLEAISLLLETSQGS